MKPLIIATVLTVLVVTTVMIVFFIKHGYIAFA